MASSSKKINSFQVAVLLEKASLGDVEILAAHVDLGKLTRLINQFFTTEVVNVGAGISIGNVTTSH